MIFGRKPIMTAAIESEILDALVMYQQRAKWKAWGLHNLRKQGAAILLEGPPGCGKTVIAEWAAIKVRKKGLKEISFKDFGSNEPGRNAKNIAQFFEECYERETSYYVNECDSLLYDRKLLGPDMMWMLEIINEFLVQIERYPYLGFLSTNLVEIIDPALERRLLARIHIGRPELPERKKLWTVKMPEQIPFRFSDVQLDRIAALQLTGAEIETAIIKAASMVLRKNRKPKFEDFYQAADRFHFQTSGEHAPKIK